MNRSTAEREVLLEVTQLGKRYGKTAVLAGLDLTVRAGEVHGLLGPNGSGKTTALHAMTGLVAADSGSVNVVGLPIASPGARQLIGFAPDDLPLPQAMTASEFLDLHDALRERDDRDTARTISCLLDLDIGSRRLIAHYSHGMKRKLHLIASVMHVPDVLFLDEPFRGLDPRTGAVLRQLITALARAGSGVVVATHDMLRAERDCDSVTILADGQVLADGSPQALIAASPSAINLEEVFLEKTISPDGSDQSPGVIAALFADIEGQPCPAPHA